MDNIHFKNNKFIENKNDVVSCAGDNIVFEGNEFSSTVNIYGRTTNYKFLNNKFENIKQNICYEFSSDVVCSGNKYIKSNFVVYKKGAEGKIEINNENLVNSSIYAMSNSAEIKNSKITSDNSTQIRLAGMYRECDINVSKGDLVSSKMYNCNINNTSVNSEGESYFEECSLNNSTINSTTSTKTIKVNKSKLNNSNVSVSTWGNDINLNIENSNILINSNGGSLIHISAAKMKDLVFKNNIVNNDSSRPTFNMYDTDYRVPNGNAILENNEITQTNYKYVFDGVDIKQGIFRFTQENNILNGAEILSPKYINNQYFKINN